MRVETISVDVRFINPFIRSVHNVFKTMCRLEPRVGKPYVKVSEEPYADVSGVIGFSGDASGSIVLTFMFDAASKIATAFAGVPITPEHRDFADAIGELANMVAGNAKKEFGEGLSISISLPNVIVGSHHAISPSKSHSIIIVPCETDMGSFNVEVSMVMEKKSVAAKAQPVGAAV